LPYEGKSLRTTEQAEFTYVTKFLTRSTGNKWSISEDSVKPRRVLTAWQATNRLPGAERTRIVCIFTQVSTTCACRVTALSEIARVKETVTHGTQIWYVYFLTLITHKGNVSLANKVNVYSGKPLLKAVSSSQFASASITPTCAWRWGQELSKHCHRNLRFMLQMAVLVLLGKVWVLGRLQGGLCEQGQLQLFQQGPAADLRTGKTAAKQQLGLRSEKWETALQAPQSVQKEHKRGSKPCMRSSKAEFLILSWHWVYWMLLLANATASPS